MRRVLSVIGASLALACSSSKPTQPALALTVTGGSSYQGRDTTIGGEAKYVCDYTMLATASGGSADEVATWGGGHETWKLASDGRLSSNVIPAADVYFGNNPEVPAGTQVSGAGYAYWDGSFSLSKTFYYSTPQSSNDSTTYSFQCN